VITPTPLPKATPTERPEVSGDAIKRAVGAMSDEQKVGQLFLIGFAGPLTQVQIASFQQHHFGGLLLVQLNNNASGPAQTASFVNALQAAMASEPPLLVATDQEGGTVCLRWASITCFPGARRLALLPPQDAALAENDVDEELLAEGFNLHLAPVADVWDGEHPFMADRAFGQDPATVSAHIAAIIQAGHASGMMMTAKHFPGHGGASADSHVALPIVYHTRSVLEATDLPPFRTAIAAGVDVVMMAHLIVPAIDPDRPTSLSPNAHALLRGELGYTGVIMSDDIGMGAITSKGKTTADATVEALIAGTDIVILIRDVAGQDAAYQAVLAAVHDGRISEARLDASVARILALKARYHLADHRVADVARAPAIVGSAEHQQAAKMLAAR
jgi:beta-N-acetylhexosaminidase